MIKLRVIVFIENVVVAVAVAVAVAVVAFMENMKFKDKFTLNQFYFIYLIVSVMECARAQW